MANQFGNRPIGFFNNYFSNVAQEINKAEQQLKARPMVNIIENEEQFSLEMAVAGWNREEISIDITNDMLTISGKVAEKSENTNKYHRHEFGKVDFERSFKLSNKVDTEKITATFNAGILTVVLPKSDKVKSKISVNIA